MNLHFTSCNSMLSYNQLINCSELCYNGIILSLTDSNDTGILVLLSTTQSTLNAWNENCTNLPCCLYLFFPQEYLSLELHAVPVSISVMDL